MRVIHNSNITTLMLNQKDHTTVINFIEMETLVLSHQLTLGGIKMLAIKVLEYQGKT